VLRTQPIQRHLDSDFKCNTRVPVFSAPE